MVFAVFFKQCPQGAAFGEYYQHVIKHTHLVKKPYLLKSAGDAINLILPRQDIFSFRPGKNHRTAVMREKSGKQVDKRRLPASVGPHQAGDHTFRDMESNVI